MATTKGSKAESEYPDIFQRYVDEVKPGPMELPRHTTRRFHGREVSLWQGYVHVDSVEGYVENLRLRFYLNQWQSQQKDSGSGPSTDEVYQIMVDADAAEHRDSARPFHIKRMADSIVRNNVREPIIICYRGNGDTELWDGNRRFFGTKHIMADDAYVEVRQTAQWLPAYVYLPSGNAHEDAQVKLDILVECNFVEPEQISWPSYVKAEQVYIEYQKRMKADPGDSYSVTFSQG